MVRNDIGDICAGNQGDHRHLRLAARQKGEKNVKEFGLEKISEGKNERKAGCECQNAVSQSRENYASQFAWRNACVANSNP